MDHSRYLPLHPIIFAIAQELQRRATEAPEANILEVLAGFLTEKPQMDMRRAGRLSAQVNDLMGIATPPHDTVRMALMLFLPEGKASLFTSQEILTREVLLLRFSPCLQVAGALAHALDDKWPEVVATLQTLPMPPAPLVNGSGNPLPAEARSPQASGPVRGNIQDFLLP